MALLWDSVYETVADCLPGLLSAALIAVGALHLRAAMYPQNVHPSYHIILAAASFGFLLFIVIS